MIFHDTPLPGVCVIEIEKHSDERGFFARTWCQAECAAHGLNPRVVQCNTSFSRRRGTLRGMHYQEAPHQEAKLIRCTAGAVYDAIIDLRPQSPTFKRWTSVELAAENGRMLYVPEGFAHGFQSLVDNTEVFYQMSEFYHPESARGVRWNDPAFALVWPDDHPIISARDQAYPDFLG